MESGHERGNWESAFSFAASLSFSVEHTRLGTGNGRMGIASQLVFAGRTDENRQQVILASLIW